MEGKGTDEDPLLCRPMAFIRLSLMKDADGEDDSWVLILSDNADLEQYAIALTEDDMDDLIEAYYAND
jgi:hypothetical protein